MNEESVKKLLAQMHRAFPGNRFSFNFRYFEADKFDPAMFQFSLHQNRSDARGEFVYAQGKGVDLSAAYADLVASIKSLLSKSRDDLNIRLAKEVATTEQRTQLLNDCLASL